MPHTAKAVQGKKQNVPNACVGILPHDALLWLDNSNEILDQSRLARTVDADAGHTRCHRRTHSDVVDRGRCVAGVRERDVVHLEQSLAARLDALEERRLGEAERELGRLELEVALGLGVVLDEGRQVALVRVELEAINLMMWWTGEG